MTTTTFATIRKFDYEFGFATGDDGRDYFVHKNDLTRAGITTLTRGDRVEIDPEPSPKGWRTRSIRLVERGTGSGRTGKRFFDLSAEP